MCPRNFEGSSAKASLELKYDGGLGTAHGRLRLVHVGTTASDRSMSIAKPGGKTAWAAAIWRRMLEINADQVFSIGLVGGVPQPIVVNSNLRNVPEKGVFNWNPGSHFGVYMPDTFWFDNAERRQAKR